MTATWTIPVHLEPIPVPPEAGDLPVPHYVDCFIRDAEQAAEELGPEAGGGQYVPSDYRYAFQVLQWLLQSQKVSRGATVLEWGSGQGMVTIMAALLGYRALGVERDVQLVRAARDLAARFDVAARFVQGTYDPAVPGLKPVPAQKRDVIYAYPWPGDEPACLQLFAQMASPGAYLLTCLGPEDIRAYRRKED